MPIVVFLFLVQAVAPAETPAEAARLFSLGVGLHAEGDVSGAIAAFEGASATGWTSGTLHYNLGTAYLAKGELGFAVLHLERANRILPGDPAVVRNLRIARERAGLNEERPPLTHTIADLVGRFGGLYVWLAFGFVLFVALLGLLGYRIWYGVTGAWPRRTVLVLLPVTTAILLLSTAAWNEARSPVAIVVTEEVEVHAAPSPESPTRSTLEAGQRVRVAQTRGAWDFVRGADGVSGWLPSRAVEPI